MISKNELKYYSSLLNKKFRLTEKKFIAEGEKIVLEGMNSDFENEIVLMTNEYYELYKNGLTKINNIGNFKILANKEFEKISETKNPQGIAAIFRIKPCEEIKNANKLIYFDNINDPGNLGTLIRSCDWFGFENILISENSADYLNGKSIRASMGSIFHLNILANYSTDLEHFKDNGYYIIAADLKGEDINHYKYPEKFVLILSNESNGLSLELKEYIDSYINIPSKGQAESLNVAIAGSIILSNISKN